MAVVTAGEASAARRGGVQSLERAFELLELMADAGGIITISQLAAAATYQRFLDHIEVTERVYHALDPADRLRAAIAADGSPAV